MKKRMMVGIAKGVVFTVLVTTLAGCVLVGDFPFSLGASWKEEVLLPDSSKIIVKRSQTRGGRHEIGQDSPVAEHIVSFVHPATGQAITWESTYGNTMEDSSLLPLGLYIENNTVYLMTTAAGCIAYNKWGRPNPPYVCFKYDGLSWQRIPLEELPAEFKEANLVISGLVRRFEQRLTQYPGPVPADEIKKINTEAKNPDVQYLRIFVREPLDPKKTRSSVNCEELIFYKGAWIGPGDSIGRRMMDRISK